MSIYIHLFPAVGLLGLICAGLIYFGIKKISVTDTHMAELADSIHDGAMVFLRREYSILIAFILLVFVFLYLAISTWTGIAFLCGALSSMLAGFIGLKAATRSNVRTTQAARDSGIELALNISFSGGAVMGLSVASLGAVVFLKPLMKLLTEK